jgi:hypothetical protein
VSSGQEIVDASAGINVTFTEIGLVDPVSNAAELGGFGIVAWGRRVELSRSFVRIRILVLPANLGLVRLAVGRCFNLLIPIAQLLTGVVGPDPLDRARPAVMLNWRFGRGSSPGQRGRLPR